MENTGSEATNEEKTKIFAIKTQVGKSKTQLILSTVGQINQR